ncbi:MAG: CRISPR-associated helicase Cas3' [Candidatus Hydrogenedentes bacterium]|nr:CRISPR-associated helicase Cas3' [Candidatus Hydrogenedentota bacterium]
MPDVILAKSCRNGDGPRYHETLAGHSDMVAKSFCSLFGQVDNPSHLGQCWTRFFNIPKEWWSEFWRTGLASSCLHDMGKANSSFQAAVRRPGTTQAVRHEHFSGILLHCQSIQEWISSFCQWERVVTTILGHHLRFNYEEFCQEGLINAFQCNIEGVAALLCYTAETMGTSPMQGDISLPVLWTFDGRGGSGNLADQRDQLKSRLVRYDRNLKRDQNEARMLRAIRVALLLADSAGSAIPRRDMPLENWITEVFSPAQLLTGQHIVDKVIQPRIRQISSRSGAFRWSSFQKEAGSLSDRALLMTPCGSGKTLAAWRWIEAQLQEHPVSRVIFLYPTRGTAAEGFRDYVSWAPESDAALITGTSRFDLEGMFSNTQDERAGRDYLADDRLYALGFWPRRIFSATVDQFLAFMQNSYHSSCLLPLLADSVMVIDEVHSFDRGLFAALKGFLANFTIPVLCMTASLPANRVEDLRNLGLRVFPGTEDHACFSDLEERAHKPRYHVNKLENEQEAMQHAKDALAQGFRVLWVVNTTERCRRIAGKLDALCYHSRYRLVDRKVRHEAVVHAFQQRENPAIAVTTQVCEMSLDLDADVLISEYAPVTSLIQRMGRCNRHEHPGKDRTGTVLLYDAENLLPYSREDMAGVPGFTEAIIGRDVSQAELQDLLERHVPDTVEVQRWLAFLQAGVEASSREAMLRDSDDHTVSAVLDTEIEEYCRLRREKNPQAEGLVLPVPKREAKQDARLAGYLYAADASRYDAMLGYGNK